ncbi:hypothetical protein Tco_0627847 [Tanacetum coccineum]|uniref:Retrotransposon protein, putative, Ty1-copia subclass n=1 Tax=Tanacetum coccineum TaxID=301880 RepID=A0ABQ4WNP2_9ASTR
MAEQQMTEAVGKQEEMVVVVGEQKDIIVSMGIHIKYVVRGSSKKLGLHPYVIHMYMDKCGRLCVKKTIWKDGEKRTMLGWVDGGKGRDVMAWNMKRGLKCGEGEEVVGVEKKKSYEVWIKGSGSVNTKDIVPVYEAKREAALNVSCYADASFQTDKDNTKSQTRYVFVLNGGVMDWKSAKKSTTGMSSTEPKYIAAATSMEVV